MAVEPLLAQLVGTWRGSGTGEFPGMGTFPFEEEVTFIDVGTRDVVYMQRAWDPGSGEVLHAETGTWRATPDGVLAATIAQPRTAEVSEGNDRSWCRRARVLERWPRCQRLAVGGDPAVVSAQR